MYSPPTGGVGKHSVFLSYSSPDVSFAARLRNSLLKHGASPWLDRFDIQAGSHWDRSIQAALSTCSHLVVVHSATSFASDNVWDEWSFFLNRNKPVIPVILEKDVELPFRLERLHYVNFCTQSYRLALQELLTVIPHLSPTPDNSSHAQIAQRAAAKRHSETKAYFDDVNENTNKPSERLYIPEERPSYTDTPTATPTFLPLPCEEGQGLVEYALIGLVATNSSSEPIAPVMKNNIKSGSVPGSLVLYEFESGYRPTMPGLMQLIEEIVEREFSKCVPLLDLPKQQVTLVDDRTHYLVIH
jgi:hypothetical protein